MPFFQIQDRTRSVLTTLLRLAEYRWLGVTHQVLSGSDLLDHLFVAVGFDLEIDRSGRALVVKVDGGIGLAHVVFESHMAMGTEAGEAVAKLLGTVVIHQSELGDLDRLAEVTLSLESIDFDETSRQGTLGIMLRGFETVGINATR